MLGSNFQPSVFGNAELVYEITKHLTATDKASAARVCHLWNNNVNWNARETVYRVCRAVSLGCIKTLRKALVNKTTRRSACILGLVSSALGMTIPFTAAIPVVPVPCDNGELGAELLSSVDEWDEDVLHFITALAASSGREGLLRVLLKVADPSGFSLTSESALDGLEILEGLIGICASGNVNARWKESKTYSRGVRLLAMQDSADLPQLPLVVAIRNNHLDIVKLLLQDERVSPTGEHIVEAVEYDKIDVVKALLEDGRADPAATHNGMLNAALVLAESPEIIRLFLDDPRIDPSVGSVFEFRLSDDEEGCYCVEPLEMILQDGRAQPVRETLKSAVKEGSSEAVLALLKDGRAVPDLRLLFDAVKSDDPIKVRGLLEDPRVIIGDCSEFEDLTLRATNGYHHCGVQIPRLLLIKRLMEEEEEMNRVDNETKPSHGDTLSRLLVDACAAGHEEVLQFLLRDGRADPSYRWPNRPLSLAITSQSWGCLEHLLEDGRAQPSPNHAATTAMSFAQPQASVTSTLWRCSSKTGGQIQAHVRMRLYAWQRPPVTYKLLSSY